MPATIGSNIDALIEAITAFFAVGVLIGFPIAEIVLYAQANDETAQVIVRTFSFMLTLMSVRVAIRIGVYMHRLDALNGASSSNQLSIGTNNQQSTVTSTSISSSSLQTTATTTATTTLMATQKRRIILEKECHKTFCCGKISRCKTFYSSGYLLYLGGVGFLINLFVTWHLGGFMQWCWCWKFFSYVPLLIFAPVLVAANCYEKSFAKSMGVGYIRQLEQAVEYHGKERESDSD